MKADISLGAYLTGHYFRDTLWMIPFALFLLYTLMITKSTTLVGSDTRRDFDTFVCHASL